ncbi:glycoside hydrolase [Rhizopus microsporus var. microsporus]|uniref:glucan endo-1,3-beta-D-glucosidase n=2 Tax=Rhizopus microsporus TaxID=58291 RepID=A0A2G4SZE6_RHIZD|nr:glycoside hydrolase [Rhizopus microsporus ATCC 52813]ORE03998.1 glycoside hydrolase [Rhizopus microsporus var. microsporus]PHZ14124.1 glycoside hydrolase [Rhizopus microsporus ATCC 52813]
MQLIFILAVALIAQLAGLVQALPVERRSGSIKGVTYTARNSDGSCQSASQIANSVKLMKSNGIMHIRTYSQECNQLSAILNAINAQGGGMTVLAAVWIDGTSNDDQEISTLKSVLAKNIGNQYIRGILVGNEVLFKSVISEADLISKINQVKAFAKNHSVGTAEIPGGFSSKLVSACDMVSANVYPFFAKVDINSAMSNLNLQYNNIKAVAGSKEVLITETGWPSSGSPLGSAVPSQANAQKYVTGLMQSSLPYYYFEWQDSDWKQAGTEASFGLLNSSGKMKYAL